MEALMNLPSRGNLATPTGPILSRAPKSYVADHKTEPPVDQVIRTDPENILIRTLLQRRNKALGGGKGTQAKGADKGKRAAQTPAERADAKRSNCGAGPSGEGGSGRSIVYTADALRSRTIPELADILKSRGLSASRGKKEELVQRILEAQERAKRASQS